MDSSKTAIGCCLLAAACFTGVLIAFGSSFSKTMRSYLEEARGVSADGETDQLRAEAEGLIYGTAGHIDVEEARVKLRAAWDRGDKLAGMRLCMLDTTYPHVDFNWTEHEQRYSECQEAVFNAAQAGDKEAQHVYAMSLYWQGTEEYATLARSYADRSARQAYHPAQLLMGFMTEREQSEDGSNLATAAQWYRQAADQGSLLGQTYLANLLVKPDWSGSDPQQGLALLNDSATKGDAVAMYYLGRVFEEGTLVAADPAQALDWYSRGAEAGYSRAMTAAGMMYEEGRGIEAERTEAARWYRMAADRYDKEAVAGLQRLGEPVEQYLNRPGTS